MKTGSEKALIFLSAGLIIFSAFLLSYSALTTKAEESNNTNSNLQNTTLSSSELNDYQSDVLGLNDSETEEIINQVNPTAPINPTTPQVIASTEYINTNNEPLSAVKPKNFYFVSVTTNLSEKNFRIKYQNGTFSEYQKIEAPDNLKGDIVDPITKASVMYTFEEDFTEVELDNNPGDIKVTFMNNISDQLSAAAYNVAYDYEREYKENLFGNFDINLVTREEWGAPSYSEWIPDFTKITRIVVHHTATSVNMGDPASSVRAIYNDHKNRCSNNSGYYPNNCTQENTWSDIGYNYLIDSAGQIYEGRSGGNGVVGAHAIPNSGAIGIALLGNLNNIEFTTAMRNSLTKLTGALSFLNDYKVVWQESLFGHRDYLNTECPSNQVYTMLPQIAINAENIRKTYAGTNNNRNLIGKLSYGQDFIRRNTNITSGGTTHIYLIADDLTPAMKQKLKGSPAWSGTYDFDAYGDNVVAYIRTELAYLFVGEVGMAIPNIQFSADLP